MIGLSVKPVTPAHSLGSGTTLTQLKGARWGVGSKERGNVAFLFVSLGRPQDRAHRAGAVRDTGASC
jgi:hypothetical protein